MKIQPPQLPASLQTVEDFASLASLCLSEERPMEEALLFEQALEGQCFATLDLKRCTLENCALTDCDFSKSSFSDVLFRGCNLSNSRFRDAYFSRCHFENCKWVGTDCSEAVFRQVSAVGCNLRYCCLDGSKMTDLHWVGCDFSEASLSEVRWKSLLASDCRFVQTTFFKTPLKGFDFTQSELERPVCSSPPVELRGALVTWAQAAGLAGLLGVVIVQ